jgi:hypothetical protein
LIGAAYHYKGYDVAPVVVSTDSQRFSRPNVSFYLYSGNPTELPAADLLIVKDVLQHLPNRMIFDFLPILKQYRYALITNCTNPKNEDDVNHDIDIGGFHYLDLRKPPFNVDAQLVYTFCKIDLGLKSKVKALLRGYPSWKKLVLLVKTLPATVAHTIEPLFRLLRCAFPSNSPPSLAVSPMSCDSAHASRYDWSNGHGEVAITRATPRLPTATVEAVAGGPRCQEPQSRKRGTDNGGAFPGKASYWVVERT